MRSSQTFPVALLMLSLLGACSSKPASQPASGTDERGPLFDQIAALDAGAFAAFNTCDQPGQLQKHASYFSESVEFYHDNGGVTWNRKDMLANTEKYVCGNFRRELVPGSLHVYPVKDFGAIETGVHKFCQFKTGACEGEADFLIVWHQDGAQWLITRVMSYGHRSAK